MPTLVDSLIVSLGLDASSFDAGQKKVANDLLKTRENANKTAKEMEILGKQAAMFFTRVRNEAIGLFAVFTAGRGLKEFTRDITQSDAATGRLAHNLNTTTEELTAWEGAAKRAGGTAAGFDGTVTGLTQQFQQLALHGTAPAIPYFRALGVTIADTAGKMRPVGDILLDLADKFQDMDPARASAYGAGLGLDQGTINLLEKGRAAVLQLLDAQRRRNVVTADDAKRAQELSNATQDLEDDFTGLGRSILNDVTPYLVDLIKTFDVWLQANKGSITENVGGFIRSVGDFLKGMNWAAIGAGISGVASSAKSLVDTLGGFARVSEVLLGIWAGSKALRVLGVLGRFFGLGGGAAAAGAGAGAAEGGGLLAMMLRWAPRLSGIGAFIAGMWPGAAGTPNESAQVPGGPRGTPAPRSAEEEWDHAHPLEALYLNHAPVWAGGRGTPGVNPNAPNGVPRTGPVFGPQGAGDAAALASRPRDWATPRGIWNNNPGNIEFANQPGAAAEIHKVGPHTEAVFGSMERGLAEMAALLGRYQDKYGRTTAMEFVEKWAPKSDGNPTEEYAADVAKAIGVGVNDRIDVHNPTTMRRMMKAMIAREEGANRVTDAQLEAGVALYAGGPSGGAPSTLAALMQGLRGRPLANVPSIATGAGAFLANRQRSNTDNSRRATTHFNGPITIQAPEATGQSIATSLKSHLQKYDYVGTANYGLA